MRISLEILKAFLVFSLLLLTTRLLLVNVEGNLEWVMNGEKVEFPIEERVEEPRWIELRAEFTSDGSGVYLVLPRMGLSNMTVYLNGEEVERLGGEEEHSRMWTYTFVVHLNPKEGKNELLIRSYVLYDYRINWPPYLSKNPWMRVFMSNLFFSEIPKTAFGIVFALGLFLIVVSRLMKDPTPNRILGLSMLAVSAFLIDHSYFPLYVKESTFLFMRRVFYVTPLFSMATYYYGVERTMMNRIPRRSVMIPLIFLSFSPIFIPSFRVARMFVFLTLPLVILLTFSLFIDTIRSGKTNLISPFAFMLMTALHSSFASLLRFPNPGIMSYGVAYSTFAVFHHVYEEYRRLSRGIILERKRSMIDPLTGALNRRAFSEIPRDMRGCVIFLDLNGFKEYNDRYGHDKGDEVLKKFSEIVKRRIRKSDLLIRYGGDEFVLLLPGCEVWEASKIAGEIREAFERKTGLGFSYGVALLDGNIEKAIREADEKMYEMKRRDGKWRS